MLISLTPKITFLNPNLTDMEVGANKPAIPISISTTIGVGIGGLVMVFIMVGLTLILVGDILVLAGAGVIHTIGTLRITGVGVIRDMLTEMFPETLFAELQDEPFTVRLPIHYARQEHFVQEI